ncbi:MAG TPA: hypothetical protein VM938_10200 [Acidimicrobiales bacterium]|nr:hypothetical protein [Acidimicrobiales bacterium]
MANVLVGFVVFCGAVGYLVLRHHALDPMSVVERKLRLKLKHDPFRDIMEVGVALVFAGVGLLGMANAVFHFGS